MDGSKIEVQVRATTPASQLTDSVSFEGQLQLPGRAPIGVIVYDRSDSFDNIEPGQYAKFYGRLKAADTRYGEDYDYYHTKGIFLTVNVEQAGSIEGRASAMALVYRLRNRLIERIDAVFDGSRAVFIRALMTGDKYAFYDDLALSTDMSIAGLTHIVAVSGMHISILAGILCVVFGKSRPGSIMCMCFIWLFVLMTGASPSAVRAGIMNSMLLIGGFFGRESDTLHSLVFALALILLENPFAAASVSLQLSFSAVLGIVWLSRAFRELDIYRRNTYGFVADYLVDTTVCSLGVVLFTAPLSAVHFGTVSILSFLSNLLCLWAVPICFCAAYIACLLPPLSGIIIKGAAFLAGILTDYMGFVAKLVSKIPFACAYTEMKHFGIWLLISYAAVLAIFYVSRKKKLIAAGAVILFSVLLLQAFTLAARLQYEKGTTFAAIDVGQGQSLAVMSGDKTVVVDCGSIMSFDNAGETVGPYLMSRGRRSIDLLLLSHLHSDHANGVAHLMEYIPVKELILPENIEDEDELLAEILNSAERNGTAVRIVGSDEMIALGGLSIELFAPPAEGKDNEKCLCMRISAGDYDCMLSGDSPAARERQLVRQYELSDTELVIVGHHGSKYSSCEDYLSALGGETAIISCGYNTYGHPTEDVLERLRLCGYNIYRTDVDSTVEIRIP